MNCTDYKLLFNDMVKILDMYQNEIVPRLREALEERADVVRCKDCKYFNDSYVNEDGQLICWASKKDIITENDFCSTGERKKSFS